MSNYSLSELVPWLLVMVSNVYMYFLLRRTQNPAFSALRKYLGIQCIISPLGFVLLWAFGDAAYYPETIFSLAADAVAQAILLYGAWKSFGSNTLITGRIAVAVVAFALSLGAWSAQRTAIEANLYQHSTWPWMCINHAIGYGFCYAVALFAFMSCLKDLDWHPGAARIITGYGIYLAGDFGVGQMQLLLHWHLGPWTQIISSLAYFVSLAIWLSAIPLDIEISLSEEETASLKRALTDAIGLFETIPTIEDI